MTPLGESLMSGLFQVCQVFLGAKSWVAQIYAIKVGPNFRPKSLSIHVLPKPLSILNKKNKYYYYTTSTYRFCHTKPPCAGLKSGIT